MIEGVARPLLTFLERAPAQPLRHVIDEGSDARGQRRIAIVDRVDGLPYIEGLPSKKLDQPPLLAILPPHEVFDKAWEFLFVLGQPLYVGSAQVNINPVAIR
ncbi:hypothetical protein GCM10025795_34190 [Verticiella sediminum]